MKTQPKQTTDQILVSALRKLACDIVSEDGIATSAILEGAERIEQLSQSIETIRDAILHERYQLAESGLDCDQVNSVLGIIDDHDARVIE